jgi:hypothetical protein
MKKSKESNGQNHRKCPSVTCTCGSYIEADFMDKVGGGDYFAACCWDCDKYWAIINQTKEEGEKIIRNSGESINIQTRECPLITCTCGFQIKAKFLRKVGNNKCFIASCPHCEKHWVVINDIDAMKRIRSKILKSIKGGVENGGNK